MQYDELVPKYASFSKDASIIDRSLSSYAQQGKALLTQLLAGRRCLLVVDNVWAAQDLGDLDVVEAPGRLLFTTRDTAIVRAVGATCFEVTGLSIRESLVLLARWARLAVEALPREALGDRGRMVHQISKSSS